MIGLSVYPKKSSSEDFFLKFVVNDTYLQWKFGNYLNLEVFLHDYQLFRHYGKRKFSFA